MKTTHPILRMPADRAEALALASALVGHKKTVFGNARMDAREDKDKDKDKDKTDPPKPGPPKDDKKDDKKESFKDPDTGEEYDFPVDTPTEKMTVEQKLEYWRHKARKHERAASKNADYDKIKQELDDLKQKSMTEDEKAQEKLKSDSYSAGREEERRLLVPQLVEAQVRGALQGRQVPKDKIDYHLEFLDHSKFLTEDNKVDTDKVSKFAAGFGQSWPDMGQGDRGSSSGKSSVSSAKEDYLEKRRKKSA